MAGVSTSSQAAGNLQGGTLSDSAAAAADSEGAALLGNGQPRQHTLPFGWLRTMGSRGRRPGYPAAASSDGGSSFTRRSSETGTPGGRMALNSEAALVEHALQACLVAADSGQYERPTGQPNLSAGAGGVSISAGMVQDGVISQAVPPAGAFAASSSGTATERGAALANSFVKAASKVVLHTKRPAAPGKKDDDDAQQPPLQQSCFDPSRHAPALPPAAPSSAGPGTQLPVSTGASAGSVHASPGPAIGTGGGAASMEGVEGGSGGASDPAAAASSAGKPLPTSLHKRKGWAWGGVLAAGPGDQGWVSDDSSRRSSLAGGRRVVEYLGQTVGNTGRLMVETTGNLLKSGNVLFQACAAPAHHQAAAAAAAAAAAEGGQQQQGAAAGDGSRSVFVVAPSSTGMDRGEDTDGPFVAALAASLAAEDEGPSDSDSDPDLQEGSEGDEDDSTFSLLDQPALRGNISALVAAVSSDAATGGQGFARVQQEEDRAAEKLLQDMGTSNSDVNIERLALQHQRPPAAAAAARTGQQQQQQQYGGRVSPNPDSLRRESPMFPPGSDRGSPTKAAGSTGEPGGSGDAGGSSSRDKAAERLARRRMYPAGRVLHMMPKSACPQGRRNGEDLSAGGAAGADAAADSDGSAAQGGASSSQGVQQLPLTAAHGSVGLGDSYVLLEVPNAGYGRVKLCPAMVRDHFIPSYLRALDSVLGQLQQVAAEDGR